MGKRDVAAHESDEFGTKLGAVVFVGAEKMCHFVQ